MRKMLFIITAIALVACGPQEHTEVIAVMDPTDPRDQGPWTLDSADVMRLFHLDEDPQRSAHLCVARCSNVRYDLREDCYLKEGGFRLLGNRFERDDEVNVFIRRSVDILSRSKVDTTLDRSVVFRSLVDRLAELAGSTSTATERILLYYGDLGEHTEELSVYGKGRHLITDSLDALKARLLSQVTIPRLDGITVYLVFHGLTSDEGLRFERAASVVKEILEEHGAHVIVTGQFDLE